MKLQNVLMCGEESQRPLLKVTGFGHAKVSHSVQKLSAFSPKLSAFSPKLILQL